MLNLAPSSSLLFLLGMRCMLPQAWAVLAQLQLFAAHFASYRVVVVARLVAYEKYGLDFSFSFSAFGHGWESRKKETTRRQAASQMSSSRATAPSVVNRLIVRAKAARYQGESEPIVIISLREMTAPYDGSKIPARLPPQSAISRRTSFPAAAYCGRLIGAPLRPLEFYGRRFHAFYTRLAIPCPWPARRRLR
jgi:hypothetical protein